MQSKVYIALDMEDTDRMVLDEDGNCSDVPDYGELMSFDLNTAKYEKVATLEKGYYGYNLFLRYVEGTKLYYEFDGRDYVKGPVTEETEELISRENQKFALLEKQYANGEITEEYWDSQMRPYEAFERFRDITTVHLKKTNGEYLHTAGYQLLTGDLISNQKDIKLGLLALIVMLYPLAYLFGIDHQLHMV